MKFQLADDQLVDITFNSNSAISSKLIEMMIRDVGEQATMPIPQRLSQAFRNYLAYLVIKRVDITVNSSSFCLTSTDFQGCCSNSSESNSSSESSESNSSSNSQLVNLLQRLQLADLLEDDVYFNFVWTPMLTVDKQELRQQLFSHPEPGAELHYSLMMHTPVSLLPSGYSSDTTFANNWISYHDNNCNVDGISRLEMRAGNVTVSLPRYSQSGTDNFERSYQLAYCQFDVICLPDGYAVALKPYQRYLYGFEVADDRNLVDLHNLAFFLNDYRLLAITNKLLKSQPVTDEPWM